MASDEMMVLTMQQELTTQGHINADGMLQVMVPDTWADQDVTVKLTLEGDSNSSTEENSPTQQTDDQEATNLAELMKGYVGTCSFDVPEDIHQRGSEIFGDILIEKHQRRQQEHLS